jgi:hypothetical protein
MWSEEEVEYLRQNYSETPNKKIAEQLGRTENAVQDKARRENLEKHEQSRLINKLENTETLEFKDESFNHFIAGFVAGEGTFTHSGDKKIFRLHLAQDDKEILEKIQKYFGVGNIYEREARKENWKKEVIYTVQSKAENWNVIVPFFEKTGLRNTHKQKQFEKWKTDLRKELPL